MGAMMLHVVVMVMVLSKDKKMMLDSPEEWNTVCPVLVQQIETGTR